MSTSKDISFTLCMFKKEIRNLPFAWRCLGYVVNQSNVVVSDSSDKAQDYHFILSFILSSLKDAQEHAGISWKLKYQVKVLDVVMKIPILFVIGDTEGHDKLCGKYLNRVNAAVSYTHLTLPTILRV